MRRGPPCDRPPAGQVCGATPWSGLSGGALWPRFRAWRGTWSHRLCGCGGASAQRSLLCVPIGLALCEHMPQMSGQAPLRMRSRSRPEPGSRMMRPEPLPVCRPPNRHPRSPGSASVLEERRRLVIQMLQDGGRPVDVARRLHVSRQSISRWQAAYRELGATGIESKPHPGPHPKLGSRESRALQRLLLKGARANGYSTDFWTRQREADVIAKVFGVR